MAEKKHEQQFLFINLKDCKDAYHEWKSTQKEPISAALSWVRACQWQKEQINEVLLSEVLPCFMHCGEADEVVAKLDEVLNQKK